MLCFEKSDIINRHSGLVRGFLGFERSNAQTKKGAETRTQEGVGGISIFPLRTELRFALPPITASRRWVRRSHFQWLSPSPASPSLFSPVFHLLRLRLRRFQARCARPPG